MFKNLDLMKTILILIPFLVNISFPQTDYYGSKIKSDNLGNSYVAGNFRSSYLNFGPYSLKNSGLSDIYLVKYNLKGKVVWAKSFGGNGNEKILSMEVDNIGNVSFLVSSNSNKINFEGSHIKNDKPETIFKIEFNSSGNVTSSGLVEKIESAGNNSTCKIVSDTSLTIISPGLRDTLQVGTGAVVEWQSQNINDILIELSTDNGISWQVISTYPAVFNEFPFVVPDASSNMCLIRISSAENPEFSDTSDLFNILGQSFWEIKESSSNSVFNSVYYLNSDTCFVAGYNGISKSSDGGENWVNSLDGTGLFDVFF